jgi:nitroimidazol reductase NimA-like FMN-containing flavoprotein (pyridoxamine 5'-phosphate oxidase superfamily)
MSLAMTRAEREAFLAALHVGVIALPEAEHGPLTVPIWYAYEPGGDVRIITDRDSRKGRLLAVGARVSLCVQNETPPYQYVSVEGPIVSIDPTDPEHDGRPMAHRYLGKELGDAYVAATAGDRTAGGSVLVRIRPERWLTVDYKKQFQT